MLEAKGLEAGAREEARWDGRDFDALGSADRSRYLGRFADGVTAYLEAVGGEPVQAPAVRVKGLADKLKLAEYVMTKDSFCEAERLEEGLSVVRRIRSALVATPPAAMTCDEQFALATKLAGDLGYDLVPEPPHPDTPVDNFSGQATPPAERVVEEQVKHMVQRFLQWELPKDFRPDGGISFDPIGNKGTKAEFERNPHGTNLLNHTQATAMVRQIMSGIPGLVAEPATKTLPYDLFTHRDAWRKALEAARDTAEISSPDIDDRSYWQHELDVFDRVFAALAAKENQNG